MKHLGMNGADLQGRGITASVTTTIKVLVGTVKMVNVGADDIHANLKHSITNQGNMNPRDLSGLKAPVSLHTTFTLGILTLGICARLMTVLLQYSNEVAIDPERSILCYFNISTFCVMWKNKGAGLPPKAIRKKIRIFM